MERKQASEFPQELLDLFHEYQHGEITRRDFFDRASKFAVGGLTVTAIWESLKPNYAWAQQVPKDDPRIATSVETVPSPAGNGSIKGLLARPAKAAGKLPTVLVIHENRGLTPHFHDLVKRFAAVGYSALCVDLLSPEGGTDSFTDPAAAPTALSKAPMERLVGDLRAGIDELERRVPGAEIGAVGFCFGGGMTWNLLNVGEDRLAAAVPFYGPAPENPDFSKAKAAVLAIYGALDTRVNATRPLVEAALVKAGLPHKILVFEGADHAFFNDTGARFNAKAAAEAWVAVLDWFKKYLD